MGQPIKEPTGTLLLGVKVLIPQNDAIYLVTNNAWKQERCVAFSMQCTYADAVRIAELHRKINGDNAVAEWEGSVTL